MFFLLISTTQSFESTWIEWSDIGALSQICKISKSEFCEFSSKSENFLGMNVWHRIKALFAPGQLCYTTNFSTKTQVFTKLRAGKRKKTRNYESHHCLFVSNQLFWQESSLTRIQQRACLCATLSALDRATLLYCCTVLSEFATVSDLLRSFFKQIMVTNWQFSSQ